MSKKIIAAVVVAALVAFVGVRIKQAGDLASYASANNCKWGQTGSAYGDDRDWICK